MLTFGISHAITFQSCHILLFRLLFYLYEQVFIKYHSVLGFEKSFLDTKVLTAIQKSFGFMLIANIQKGTKFLIFTLHKK